MKTFLKMGLALAVLCAVSVANAGERREWTEKEYMEYQAAQRAAQLRAGQGDEPGPPSGAFVVIPQYFHSKNSRTSINFDGARLNLGKSKANGAGVTALFSKRLSDFFTLNLMYEYGFMKITGSPIDPTGFDGRTSQRFHSHVVGVLPEFNFGKFGKLQLSLIQGFDRSSGDSTWTNGNVVSHDDDGTDVTSLMAWHEKDIALNDSWKLTPYVGWRSLYVVVKPQDTNLWAHLASGGVKLSYQCGKLGFSVRGGVNYRTSKADIPGYGNRAVAPGVVNFSHRANLDRTVGSAGLGFTYAVSPRAVLAVGYDGFYGSDTTNHMGGITAIFPF